MGRKKLTIDEMQEIAQERGGRCLSSEYIDARTNLLWECEKGHRWKAKPLHVKSSTWCPICARKKVGKSQRLTIEEMQELAKRKGGKCLSKKYIGAYTKLTWQCEKGHTWDAAPYAIKTGEWCPVCSRISGITIKDMQEIAEARGGKCLSKEYKNTHAKLLWECSKGHTWKAEPSAIKSGYWCPHCAGVAKLTIEWAQKLAGNRGGKCLSKEYVNCRTKLKWRCGKGHTWEARPTLVRCGT